MMSLSPQPSPFRPPTMPAAALYQQQISSPWGDILLAATDQGLAGVWFVHRQAHMPNRSDWQTVDQHPILQVAQAQFQAYFAGQRHTFDLVLQTLWGTPFQRRVWQALTQIPYGQTTTYGQLANGVGNPKAVRAVGAAIGQNPHSIVVPCHRVLGANGSLTGFAGGLDRKQQLLDHESLHR